VGRTKYTKNVIFIGSIRRMEVSEEAFNFAKIVIEEFGEPY